MPPEAVTGLWYTDEHDGGIELYKCGVEICGRIYWMKDNFENGDVSRDIRNPDHAKRHRPLCRMEFMTGFTADGDGHYSDGTIYSPRHGADFSAEMTLLDHNTLELRGYILLPLLGESRTWTRAKTMPECFTTYPATQ